MGWGGHPEQNPGRIAKRSRPLASRVLATGAQQSGQNGPYLVTLLTLVGAKVVAGRATKRLHDGIYSKLGLKGQQGTLVRGRRRESGEALMPDEHVRDVVADSPDTGKKYESS